MTPEELKARGRRNIAIGLALGAFVVVVFVVTMIRLAEGGDPQIRGAAPGAVFAHA